MFLGSWLVTRIVNYNGPYLKRLFNYLHKFLIRLSVDYGVIGVPLPKFRQFGLIERSWYIETDEKSSQHSLCVYGNVALMTK